MTSPSVAPRQRGRPAQISRDRILKAVSSAANLDTLTMRELAGILNVSHGALYRWVKNRDELFDLVSE
ncbi:MULTISPECIES: TetR/AcrR family transcriptional regulator [Mycolicibacterium]|uniref:TetR/AcrR family transcriptional regulator n=1 Tax=Mycobacteriaceae TaxID=1762 RepID=UPI001C8D8415|nr:MULTISPECIES: TetR/AcrR family transcriptional regulator [Mycolicibacterium]QZH61224.1 TetR/AcrR family transcriptional regulator [Mycolicibacterium farcinogenes]